MNTKSTIYLCALVGVLDTFVKALDTDGSYKMNGGGETEQGTTVFLKCNTFPAFSSSSLDIIGTCSCITVCN